MICMYVSIYIPIAEEQISPLYCTVLLLRLALLLLCYIYVYQLKKKKNVTRTRYIVEEESGRRHHKAPSTHLRTHTHTHHNEASISQFSQSVHQFRKRERGNDRTQSVVLVVPHRRQHRPSSSASASRAQNRVVSSGLPTFSSSEK